MSPSKLKASQGSLDRAGQSSTGGGNTCVYMAESLDFEVSAPEDTSLVAIVNKRCPYDYLPIPYHWYLVWLDIKREANMSSHMFLFQYL